MNLVEMEKTLESRKAAIAKAMERVDEALSLIHNGAVEKPNGNHVAIISLTRKHKKHDKRVLQGKYMGLVRHLTVAQKKEVKDLKESSGYTKAIALAKKYRASTQAN